MAETLRRLAAGFFLVGVCSWGAPPAWTQEVADPVETPAVVEPAADPAPPADDSATADDPSLADEAAPEPFEAPTEDPAPPADEPPAEEASPEDPAAEAPAEGEPDAEAAAEDVAEPEPEPEPAIDWAGLVERAPEFIAVTHHAAVHMPIALWAFGALFVLIGLVAPSWRNQIPLACLVGGALTSIVTAASGWWYAQYTWGSEWREVDWSEGIVQHRWAGVALVVASLVLSVLALVSQANHSRTLGFIWRLGLVALAAGVAWVGHIGGELIQGEGFLEEAFEAWINPGG